MLREIRTEIANVRLCGSYTKFSNNFFGNNVSNPELSIRQFLNERLANEFIKQYLRALTKRTLVGGYPTEWLKLIRRRGVKVNVLLSRIFWAKWILELFLKNVTKIALFTIEIFRSYKFARDANNFVYFYNLNKNNIPWSGAVKNYDIISWYLSWEESEPVVDQIRHDFRTSPKMAGSVKVEFSSLPFFFVSGLRGKLKLVGNGIALLIFSIVNGILGRWWYVVLMYDAFIRKAAALVPTKYLAREYFFHYSSNVFRPLWTYEAESRGSKVTVYFYSTYEQPKLMKYWRQDYEWGICSWSKYLVWDDRQRDLLSENGVSPCKIKIVGPIWFADNGLNFPKPEKKSILVFDLEPGRRGHLFGVSTFADMDFVSPRSSFRFLEDVVQVLDEFNVNLVFKSKRKIGNRAVKSYSKFKSDLFSGREITLVDPNASVFKLAQLVPVVIAPAPSSTAVAAASVGARCCYYDPIGNIQTDDPALRNIELVVGVNELREWLRTHLG